MYCKCRKGVEYVPQKGLMKQIIIINNWGQNSSRKNRSYKHDNPFNITLIEKRQTRKYNQ